MDATFLAFLEKNGLYKPLPCDIHLATSITETILNEQWSIELNCPVCKEKCSFLFQPGASYMRDFRMGEKKYLNEILIHNTFLHNPILGVCSKDLHTRVIFYLRYDIEKELIIKVGQFPSPIDTDRRIPPQYQKLLSEPYYDFYRKSLALHQESIFIGAYVYLRRIIEHLLDNACDQAITESVFTKDELRKLHIDERIKALEMYLPSFMVENRNAIYGIISLAVHQLDEETCGDAYIIMKQAIDLILDDIIRNKKLATDKSSVAGALTRLRANLPNN